MRNVVTGATGLMGKALCHRLIGEGESVVAFVRASSNISELESLGVECCVVDIRDRDDVLRKFPKVERVFHLAAAWQTEHADRDEFQRVNVGATRNMLDAALANGVERFVHCSTTGVQGNIEDPPADENYRFQPGDHYQETKLEGELVAREYFANGVAGSVVRPVGTYGPGDLRFLKLFRTIKRGHFVMIGSGRTLFHTVYIDDMVEGIILAGRKDEAIGQVFTIAGESYFTLQEFVNLIAETLEVRRPWLKIPYAPVYLAGAVCDRVCRVLGISPPIYPRRVAFFAKNRAFTIDKAKKLLGYHPKVSLQEGIRRTKDWYERQGLL